jgi:hypothetical protein
VIVANCIGGPALDLAEKPVVPVLFQPPVAGGGSIGSVARPVAEDRIWLNPIIVGRGEVCVVRNGKFLLQY